MENMNIVLAGVIANHSKTDNAQVDEWLTSATEMPDEIKQIVHQEQTPQKPYGHKRV